MLELWSNKQGFGSLGDVNDLALVGIAIGCDADLMELGNVVGGES
jgi:hypothetical protein